MAVKGSKIVVSIRAGFERHSWVNPRLTAWLLSLLYEPVHPINFDLIFNIHGLAASTNLAAKGFMERPDFADAEWLCVVDNDTAPPDLLMRMMDDVPDYVDIITPVCFQGTEDIAFPQQGYYRNKNDDKPAFMLDADPPFSPRTDCFFHPIDTNEAGLIEVDRIGGGVWFIRRRVFEKMEQPYFRVVYDPFTYETVVTDDIYFQDRAQRLGFRMFCDTRYVASHFHTMDMARIAALPPTWGKEGYVKPKPSPADCVYIK